MIEVTPAATRSWALNPLSTRRSITISVAASGTFTSSLKKKRSSCASGSGYVPSYSTGFWVATTRNRSPRARLTPSEVTCRSSMASSSADWVLAGARLISSARSVSVKIGPSRNSKVPESGRYTLVPTMSEGSRSGVNWMRVKRASRAAASVRAIRVLAVPGTPSRSTCPAQRTAMYRPSITWICPTTARPIVSCNAERSAAASLWVATGGIVPCALTRSSNRHTPPLALAGIDIARQAQQLALLGPARCQHASVRKQRCERRRRVRIGQRDRCAEGSVVEVPVHARRRTDPAFELIGVARGDRSALPAAREELPHRGDVRGGARHHGFAAVTRGFAESATVDRERQEHNKTDEQRSQADRAVEDRARPIGPGSLAVVVFVEADPATTSTLQQAERQERRIPTPEAFIGQRRRVTEDVGAAGDSYAHHRCDDLTVLDEHRDERRLVGERQSAPDRH